MDCKEKIAIMKIARTIRSVNTLECASEELERFIKYNYKSRKEIIEAVSIIKEEDDYRKNLEDVPPHLIGK